MEFNNLIAEETIIDRSVLKDNLVLMGYYGINYIKKMGWFGNWISYQQEFTKYGANEQEIAAISRHCDWIERNFPNGLDSSMKYHLEGNSMQTIEGGNHYTKLKINDKSTALVQYNINEKDPEYLIKILLYRAA